MIYGIECGEPPWVVVEDAIEHVARSGEAFGVFGGVVLVMAPTAYCWDATVRIERWAKRPRVHDSEWDYVAEAGVEVSMGALTLVSGAWEPGTVVMPDDIYRVRVSGRGYSRATTPTVRLEFLLQLWPGKLDGTSVVKEWDGWKA
jgi:hypothetical protein